MKSVNRLSKKRNLLVFRAMNIYLLKGTNYSMKKSLVGFTNDETLNEQCTCDCPCQWGGPTCEDPIDPCDNHQCQNSGTCVQGGCQKYTDKM